MIASGDSGVSSSVSGSLRPGHVPRQQPLCQPASCVWLCRVHVWLCRVHVWHVWLCRVHVQGVERALAGEPDGWVRGNWVPPGMTFGSVPGLSARGGWAGAWCGGVWVDGGGWMRAGRAGVAGCGDNNKLKDNSDAGHPSERGFRRQACYRVKTSFSAMRPPPGWGCQSYCFGYGAPPLGGCPGGPGPVGRSSSIGMPSASRGRRSSRLRLLISAVKGGPNACSRAKLSGPDPRLDRDGMCGY